jgi:integral membrane protein (TIGR01906 family)
VGAFRNLACILFVVAIPVALITTNIRFVANEPRVYAYAIDEYDAVRTTGIDREQLIRAGEEIRAYFRNNEEVLSIRVVKDGREQSLFSPRETVHMQDVKDRFNKMNRVQEFSVLYALTFVAAVVLWSREVTARGLAMLVAAGSLITVAAIGGAGLLAMSGFDAAWEQFHLIIFSNDFWRLDPRTDHLIQMFPPAFWESIVFFVGLVTAAQAALVLILAALYLGATRRPAPARHMAPLYGYES